jgi:hypothetical protein
VGQDNEGGDIRGIGHEQDGDEQLVGPLEHFLQPPRTSITALGAMPQPYRIEREKARFDSGEEK